MNHQFELDISTTVRAESVEAMIKQIVETQTGRKIDTINVRYLDGSFDGYDVRFHPEVSKAHEPTNRFDKSYKIFKWDQ